MSIPPHKITQPFQLLAAWMVGMILIVGELIYASLSTTREWQSITYTVSAIILTLIFIRVIFLLQTRFRPEMQDAQHYQEIWMATRGQEINKSKSLDIKELTE